MSSANHPLPPPPPAHYPQQQQQYHQQYQQQGLPVPASQSRPRAASNFSFHSRKSSGSNDHKINLQETHEEKESKRLHTKADPSMAIHEAEPSAVASNVETSLANIRSIQHRDSMGNPITDPDRSNPTRSRWERPLDTIRSFEAAIDGDYKRKSFFRADSADASSTYNRRSSYYGGTPAGRARPGVNSGYFGGRSYSNRPDSTYMDGRYHGMQRSERPESYYNDGNGYPGQGYNQNASHNGQSQNGSPNGGYPQNRIRFPRTASEPQFQSGAGVYPMPGKQQSYETVITTASGGSGEPAGYQTDPSSENSSTERVAAARQKEAVNDYGLAGFGNNPQFAPLGDNMGYAAQNRQNGMPQQQRPGGYEHKLPPVPLHKEIQRVPVRLTSTVSSNVVPTAPPTRPAAGEKRKSWFGKRFSRSG